MPVYRVEVVEEHEQIIEEIYHASRPMYYTKIIEIEAEDEEDAEQLAFDGDGELIDENWEYGDTGDSEFYDSGEEVDANYCDTRIENIETLTEFSERARQQQLAYEQMRERARRSGYGQWCVKRDIPTHGEKPVWEV
jgi:hypothetical protein